jgi:hypothetical protein
VGTLNNPAYRTGLNRFALTVAAIVLVIGLGVAWVRVDAGDPVWLFGVAVAFAPLTYVFLIRNREEREVPTSIRAYTVFVPQFKDGSLADVIRRVQDAGYRVEATPAPTADTKLRNCQVRLRDRRALPSFGDIAISFNVHDNGAMLGYLEATDSEPGFYDEMAQFVIVALAEHFDGLEFSHSATNERRPASALRDELPATPYGLGLLPSS